MKRTKRKLVISVLLMVFAVGFVSPVFGADDVWAVLVGYDIYDDDFATSDGAWWYDFLTKFYGYDPKHVLFLSSGTGSAYEKWKEDGLTFFNEVSGINGHPEGDPVTDFPTKQSVFDALSWLEKNSSQNDKVVFISSTHGAPSRGRSRGRYMERLGTGGDNDFEHDGHDGYLCIADDLELCDGILAEKLSYIKCRDMIVIINACYSGEFIWDIERAVKTKQPNTKLRIITSASEDDTSLIAYTYEYEYEDGWGITGKMIATPGLLNNLAGFIINGLVQTHPIGSQMGYNTHKSKISVLTPDCPIEYAFEFKNESWGMDYTKCCCDGDRNMCKIILVTPGKKGEFNRDSWFICSEWKGGYADNPGAYVNPTRTMRFFFSKDRDAVDELDGTIASGGSVKINSGDTYTNSAVVTLSLSRTTTGVSKIQFSNDGSKWFELEPYSSIKTWRLPTVGNGDVDGSGCIIAYDALQALKCAAGKITLTSYESICADVDGDGKVTKLDASNILKLSVTVFRLGPNMSLERQQREKLGLPSNTLTSGIFNVYVKFIDTAGNVSVASDAIILSNRK